MAKIASRSDTQTLDELRVVEISREPTELFKILKFEGLVSSGGEAKAAIAAGQVLLNGAIETQKRKKIVSGDSIEFGDEKIKIQLSTLTNKKVIPNKIEIKLAVRKKPGDRKAIPVVSKSSTKKISTKKINAKKRTTKKSSTKKAAPEKGSTKK